MKKLILSLLIAVSPFIMNSQSIITVYTNMGDFELEMYDVIKPITAGNFIDLTNAEFYDDVIFHRIIVDFVIQGGDPTGTGSGGPGYSIPDEFDASLSNLARTISMANAGPNTGGSQFFINMVDNEYLDFDNPPLTSAHPVFGEVITGWDVLQVIQNVPVDANNRPITPVVMDSVRVTEPFLAVNDVNQTTMTAAIYPNPVTTESFIRLMNQTADVVSVAVVGLSGTIISTRAMRLDQGLSRISLNEFGIEALAPGMYFIRVDNGKKALVKSFVVSK